MFNNSKVIGAFVIGFALVATSYIAVNFGKTPVQHEEGVYAVATTPIAHAYIPVTDKNNDGVEDWQEEFVSGPPLTINTNKTASSAYALPTTITGLMGIQLVQSIIEAKGQGNVTTDKTKIISDTVDLISNSSFKDVIYSTKDISAIESSPENIRTYANTLGQIIIDNNAPGTENELDIIQNALDTNNPSELDKLDPIIGMYKKLRDQTLATPAPRGFEKQHLDLINVYQALYATLGGMKLAFSDPVVALLRTKRYQDDATGLALALQNMYTALLPYANLLQSNDPATVFAVFAPKN